MRASLSQLPDQADILRSWWATRADEATATLLRLESASLLGVNITSQTSHALRLRPQRFSRMASISADGISFPSDPADFRAAVLEQARDLYGSRPGLRMDLARLRPGIAAARLQPHRDSPPYSTLMLLHLRPEALHLPLDQPITSQELRSLLHKGSSATALDELPRPLLRHIPAHGAAVLIHLLDQCPTTSSSHLLHTALHLPLRKKEPAWLLRNSRPVLLQPYLRRLEATAVFRRLLHHLEAGGHIPSEMFAYRSQLSPQQAGLLPIPPLHGISRSPTFPLFLS